MKGKVEVHGVPRYSLPMNEDIHTPSQPAPPAPGSRSALSPQRGGAARGPSPPPKPGRLTLSGGREPRGPGGCERGQGRGPAEASRRFKYGSRARARRSASAAQPIPEPGGGCSVGSRQAHGEPGAHAGAAGGRVEWSRPVVAAPSPRPAPPLRVAAPSSPGRPSPPAAALAPRSPPRAQRAPTHPAPKLRLLPRARCERRPRQLPSPRRPGPRGPPPPAPAARGAELRWRRRQPRWRRKRQRRRRRRPLQPHTQSSSWRSDGSPTPGGEWPERWRAGSATSSSLSRSVGTGWRARAPGLVPPGALTASARTGRDTQREKEGEGEREVSGGPGIPGAGRPRSVDVAAVAAEKVLFIPS
ncbi:serine/arginine repetitive matrix protein 1-like [Phodopus roborovskii]|uniref:serine/arginine repetitive matrix protein 1-like n=1 Tax=Phodopus roborovskii TaxID=109678 RepID=UPI0021E3D5AC|nr:serine/arginine repetitive matrix protein 1-like [Phodopus roborovskii]